MISFNKPALMNQHALSLGQLLGQLLDQLFGQCFGGDIHGDFITHRRHILGNAKI